MSSAASPLAPAKRNAAGELVAARLTCLRCIQYISDLEQPLCNITWKGLGTIRKRCARCTKNNRTGYEPVTHTDLVPLLNTALRARTTLETRIGLADEEAARSALEDAQTELDEAVRSYHHNHDKVVGDTPVKSKGKGRASFASPLLGAGSSPMSLVEMQRLRRAGNAIAVGMREALRHYVGEEAADAVQAALDGVEVAGDTPEEEDE